MKFYVVGSKPPSEIQALACEDVIITGFVEDLNPLLDKMRLSVTRYVMAQASRARLLLQWQLACRLSPPNLLQREGG